MTRLPWPGARAAVLAGLALDGYQAYVLVASWPRSVTAVVFAGPGALLLAGALILRRVKVPGRSPDSAAPARKALR